MQQCLTLQIYQRRMHILQIVVMILLQMHLMDGEHVMVGLFMENSATIICQQTKKQLLQAMYLQLLPEIGS